VPRTNLSLRNARNAKSGLHDLCEYVINKLPPHIKHVVEIGAFSGDSAEIFAQHFAFIWSIDPWESGYDENDAASNPELYDMQMVEDKFDLIAIQYYPHIHKMKMTSEQAVDEFLDRTIDFVYIDALHTYEGVKADIERWLPKVKHFIGGHDYRSKHHPGVKKAVDEAFGQPTAVFPDSSWIMHVAV